MFEINLNIEISFDNVCVIIRLLNRASHASRIYAT